MSSAVKNTASRGFTCNDDFPACQDVQAYMKTYTVRLQNKRPCGHMHGLIIRGVHMAYPVYSG